MGMTHEEAMKWLELQSSIPIQWDDYSEESAQIREEAERRIAEAFRMAINALKAQTPRILTYDEILEVDRDAVWVQWINDPIIDIGIVTFGTEDKLEFFFPSFVDESIILRKENYGETWIAWSARPTDEQRTAVKWK